jgi:hypothetical protein
VAKTDFQKCVAEKIRGKGGSQSAVQNRLGKAAKGCAKKHGK